MSVTTRFAPSPTGFLHIGGVRTALFSWLYARGRDGRYVLRIEDTDRERSTPEAVQAILEGLEWLGLAADEAPVYQTARDARYREVIDQLLAEGKAYRCYASKEELDAMREEQRARKEKPRYDGRWRPMPGKTLPEPPAGVDPVIRFANPLEGAVVVNDLVKGSMAFDNNELDDLIIARADGSPTYNLCVVVDDMDMGISHVIRGNDHVANTPRQVNILKALGAEPPAYAHVPMILGPDGVKLSKRHGAVSVTEYRAMGFLPDGLLNYLVRLGWSHGDQEIFTRDEMVQHFDFDHVSSAPARFDMEKAWWVNHQYIKQAPMELLVPELVWHLRRLGIEAEGDPRLAEIVDAQRERCRSMAEMAEKSTFFFQPPAEYAEKDAKKHFKAPAAEVLADVRLRLVDGPWAAEALHEVVHAVAASHEVGLGKVAQPIRVAISGAAVTPPIDQTLALLGRDTTLERLDAALAWLAAQPTESAS
ncbi:glutamate--tRNA ligase [Algiphilus sp.]|uniref:glutamate--tRNA ligase n=1 Tax=Algiphilus sp. TaxID=1872431 RepID=UPI003B515EAB